MSGNGIVSGGMKHMRTGALPRQHPLRKVLGKATGEHRSGSSAGESAGSGSAAPAPSSAPAEVYGPSLPKEIVTGLPDPII